jgi:hypothetical protein
MITTITDFREKLGLETVAPTSKRLFCELRAKLHPQLPGFPSKSPERVRFIRQGD